MNAAVHWSRAVNSNASRDLVGLAIAAAWWMAQPGVAMADGSWRPEVRPSPLVAAQDGLSVAKESTPQSNFKAPVASVEDTAPSVPLVPVNKGSSASPAGHELVRVEDYCRVAVNEAVAAKLAEERLKAEALKKDIEAKITELEAATGEQRRWLQLRKDFQGKATDSVVGVYVQMDAEAAAQRLASVADEIAAAILSKMPPKTAGAILGEMPPEYAGRMTAFMAGAAAIAPRSGGGS